MYRILGCSVTRLINESKEKPEQKFDAVKEAEKLH
jgi:hypothetical protein